MNHVLVGGYLLQVVPALIGAFVGAPVLAREFETGTFRYAWTQGFGRWRWTLAKLVPLAVVVTAAAGAFSVLFSWYYQPYLATANQAPATLRGVPVRSRPVRPARGRVRRLDAGRVRDRRPGRHAHPPGRPRDGRHPRRLHRARPRGREPPAPALPDAAAHQQSRTCPAPRGSTASGGPKAARSRSPAGETPPPAPPAVRARSGRHGCASPRRRRSPVLRPARLHAVDQLPAGQPVLGVPVDRGRLAARAVGAAHRRDRLAGPPGPAT